MPARYHLERGKSRLVKALLIERTNPMRGSVRVPSRSKRTFIYRSSLVTIAHAISSANPFPLISGAHITKMIHGTKRVIDRLTAMER